METAPEARPATHASMDPVSESATDSRCESNVGERLRVLRVFFTWCLQHEVSLKRNYLLALVPLLVAGILCEVILKLDWFPNPSRYLFRSLGWVCAFSLMTLGIRHASRAVCWELSVELKDLVRLTGIEPSTLLWSQSISRWLTIGVSLIFLSPLLAYTRVLGGITSERWIAAGYGLLLVGVVTAAFAMMASVSSTSAKNADTTAANFTFALIAIYHGIFWSIGSFLWFQRIPSFLRSNPTAQFWFELAPFAQVYRSLMAPELFSPQEPAYWIHFPIAIIGMLLATRVMRNRFHSESSGPGESTKLVLESAGKMPPPTGGRPRCSARPLLWKDTYILGGGAFSAGLWFCIGILAIVGAMFAIASSISRDNEASLFVAILMTMCAPWVVALHFDSLMAAEFRERTWGSLLLLPIHWLDPIVSKLQAALWARRWIFPPIVLGGAFAMYRAPVTMLMALTIASLALLILIEVSVLSQFNSRKWWAGAIVGGLVILLIAGIVTVWIVSHQAISFAITVLAMTATIAGFLAHIRWRIINWTGD